MKKVNVNYRRLKWNAIRKLANETLELLNSDSDYPIEKYKVNYHAECVLKFLLSDLESKT